MHRATYRHTQIGWAILATVGPAAMAMLIVAALSPLTSVVLATAALLVLAMVLFATLTVAVDPSAVNVGFGPGLIRRRFPLTGVRTVRVVRNRWIHGWGIHFFGRGWLYNVSGFGAIELELGDGRIVRIGSDEPEILAAAIRTAAGLAG